MDATDRSRNHDRRAVDRAFYFRFELATEVALDDCSVTRANDTESNCALAGLDCRARSCPSSSDCCSRIFGTGWSAHRLAVSLEGIEFFTEAIFLGLYLYYERVASQRCHLLLQSSVCQRHAIWGTVPGLTERSLRCKCEDNGHS